MVIQATKRHYPDLTIILGCEGYDLEDMGFEEHETWVDEKDNKVRGFFTMRIEHGFPYIVHFWTDRDPSVFRRLAHKIRTLVHERGFQKAIFNVPKHDSYVKEFIEVYLNTKPYGFKNDQFYYLTGV
jgi:hypothetical protein